MADQPIAKLACDFFLQPLNLGIPEFNDNAGFDIDEVVMMLFRGPFVAGMAVTELTPLQNALGLQAFDCAVYCGERNMRALHRHAAMQVEDVRMVLGFRENLGD